MHRGWCLLAALFYMHRGFFLRAVDENAGDPLASRFSPSVLAVYNGACTYVGLMESLFAQQPRLAERMWFFYMHLFSCAVSREWLLNLGPHFSRWIFTTDCVRRYCEQTSYEDGTSSVVAPKFSGSLVRTSHPEASRNENCGRYPQAEFTWMA